MRGLGLMWAIEFAEPETRARSYRLVERLQNGLFAQLVVVPLFRDHQILIQVAGHGMPVIKGLPPLVVTEEDVATSPSRSTRRSARRSAASGDGRVRADRCGHPLTQNAVLLKLGAAILAVVAGVGAIAIAIDVAPLRAGTRSGPRQRRRPSPPCPTAQPEVAGGRIPTPTSPGFPSPPPGALVLAREAGTSALGLAIVPGSAIARARLGHGR